MDTIDTTNFCDRILTWNNMAIAQMLDGKSTECLEILRYALAHVQSALQTQAANASCLKRRAPLNTKLHDETQFQSLPLDKTASTTPCMHGNGTFAFFNRMITLSAETVKNTEDEDSALQQHQSRLLVMLFFNMAVAHHQQGLTQGKSCELTTALQLYELAFSVVEGAAADFYLGDQQMLLLGLYNNMGHVHSCFSRVTETQACVQWVQQIFLAFPATTKPLLETNDFSFFVQYMPLRPSEQGNIASAA